MATRELDLVALRIRADVDRAVSEFRRAGREVRRQGRAAQVAARGNQVLARSFNRLQAAAAGYLSLRLVGSLLRQADSYNTIQRRLAALTDTTEEYRDVSEGLNRIVDATGTRLESNAELFVRLATAAEDLGATNEDILTLTEAVAQLGQLGGSSVEQIGNATLQLAQGLGAGTFRAEEMNSVLEGMPLVAARIAEGMGLTTAQLRVAVREGNVLSRDVFQSLLSQAPEVAAQFAAMPQSLQQSGVRLQETFRRTVAQIDQAFGATRGLADVMDTVSRNVGALRRVWTTLTALIEEGTIRVTRNVQAIGPAFRLAFATIAEAGAVFIGGLANAVADVISVLPGIGDEVAAAVRNAANSTSGNFTEMRENAERELAAIAQASSETIAEIQARTTRVFVETRRQEQQAAAAAERAAEEAARRRAAGDTDAPGGPPRIDRGEIQRRVAALTSLVNRETQLFRDGIDRQRADLDAQLADNLVSYGEFYQRRRELDEAGFDAQISATRRQIAAQQELLAASTEEQQRTPVLTRIADLESTLIRLTRQRGDVATQAARDQLEAERALADELAGVRERLLEAQGQGAAARTSALEREFRDLTQRLEAQGDTAGLAIVENLINIEAAQAQLAQLELELDQSFNDIAAREGALAQQQQRGGIAEADAQRQVIALNRERAAQIEAMLPRLREVAEATGDPAQIQRIRELEAEMVTLGTTVNQQALSIQRSMEGAFSESLLGVINQTQTAEEAVLGFLDNVAQALLRMITQNLAERAFAGFAEAASGTQSAAPSGGGSGGSGALIGSIFGAFFHEGGIVGDPRVPTRRMPAALFHDAPRFQLGGIAGAQLGPNEVPAILHRGEEVLTRDDPRHQANQGAPTININNKIIAPAGTVAPRTVQQVESASLAGARRAFSRNR